MSGVREQAVSARGAGRRLAALERAAKDAALAAIAELLEQPEADVVASVLPTLSGLVAHGMLVAD